MADKKQQQKIDQVVAQADKHVGVAAQMNVGPGEGLNPRLGGDPVQQGFANLLPYGPFSPVAEPEQERPKDFVPEWAQEGRTSATYSVPGTPIISGFLTDVGEYNPDLQGRAAVQVYEKMRRGDGQVEAVLQALSLPVLAAEWDVVPGEVRTLADSGRSAPTGSSSTGAGKATQAKADEIAKFVKDNLFGGLEFRTSTGGWTCQSWDDVLRNALLMLAFGVAVHEDVYTVDGNWIRLRMLADLLPVTFYRWHVDVDGRTLLYLGQYGYRGAHFEQVSVPADKITVFNYRREGANFWGRSILRPAYPHWYVKNRLYRIDAIGAERNSIGVPVIVMPPGFSKEDHDAAVNFVTQLAAHERTGVVLPNGATFDILGVRGSTKDIGPIIEHHNEQIAVQALAMFLNLGRTHTGSRSLGETHSKFFMLALQNVANKIAQEITGTTIRRLVYYNFGLDAPCPKLIAANVQARALEDIIDAIFKLAQAGAFVSDRPVRNRIRHELGLPEEVEEGVVTIKGETLSSENDTSTMRSKPDGTLERGNPEAGVAKLQGDSSTGEN